MAKNSKTEAELTSTVDPAKEIRTSIAMMVGARLAAQKALRELKANEQTIEYDNAIEELESSIENLYTLESELGTVHQYILVGLASEGVIL